MSTSKLVSLPKNVTLGAFDVEIILILWKNNIHMYELPLKWVHKKDSKLSLIKDMPIMLYDILKIKLRNN